MFSDLIVNGFQKNRVPFIRIQKKPNTCVDLPKFCHVYAKKKNLSCLQETERFFGKLINASRIAERDEQLLSRIFYVLSCVGHALKILLFSKTDGIQDPL